MAENISDFEDFFEFDSFPEVESYELKLVGVSSKMPPPYQRSKQKLISKSLLDEIDFNTLEDDLRGTWLRLARLHKFQMGMRRA